jgi:hypothetical protein
MSLSLKVVPLALAVAVVAAAPALASDPSSGTVSSTSPQVSWTGNATGYGVVPLNILITATGRDPICPPSACDTFKLTVADAGDLVVTADCLCTNNFIELHVHKPDGKTLYYLSEQGGSAEIDIPGAATGDYTVDVLTNEPVQLGSGAYSAAAQLTIP